MKFIIGELAEGRGPGELESDVGATGWIRAWRRHKSNRI
jgi:hypothetical protein